MAGAEPLEDRAQTITLPNGNEALCVEEDRKGGVDARRLLDRLGVRGRTPVIVVCGGADELVAEELERTEAVLGPAGWVQQMHSAIEEQERRIAAERGRPGDGDLDRGSPTPS